MSEKRVVLIDEKTYHIGDVLTNFSDYFGMSLDETISLFYNYQLITKDYEMPNEDIVEDYNLLTQKLAILSHKGMNYLSLLQYVANIPDILHEDDFYELIFEKLKICHFGKGMSGKHLKQLLYPLMQIVKEAQETSSLLNELKNTQRPKFDLLARTYRDFELHYIDSIICQEHDHITDKTSFGSTKQKNLTKKII